MKVRKLNRSFFAQREALVCLIGDVAMRMSEQVADLDEVESDGEQPVLDLESVRAMLKDTALALEMTERALIEFADQLDAMWYTSTGQWAPSARSPRLRAAVEAEEKARQTDEPRAERKAEM
jgi:hypothetical protein